MKNIIEIACITDVCGIHPGFGFLSENSRFAKICEEIDIKFIGPNYKIMELMGNKSNARETMKKAGIPIIPGSEGTIETYKEAKICANEIGYPVMLKASSGGGGKGIRICNNEEELKSFYDIVKSESKAAFGDDSIYLEKVIQNPRHIEFQILADEQGNVIHLGERDCSVQRRNQKVLEETPSTIITESLRKEMGKAVVNAVKAIGYTNAGTIEFLVDKHGKYYFMEMNTRLQVEHPITEEITGIDIVKEQIKIASGENLKYKQSKVNFSGHSMECRINAEDPTNKFMPSPGEITKLILPGGKGIRIESSIYQNYIVPTTYDPMIAKIIVHTSDRKSSIEKMKQAISEIVIEGIHTNKDFLIQILENKNFCDGEFDTSFIEKEFKM